MNHDRLGYYVVDNNRYYNKLMAILDANKYQKEISWVFNDAIFNGQNWTTEPNIDLELLYYYRAKQIRERFDYVILMLSGGADSTNMLNSFLLNNIHVDEVIGSAPLSGLNNFKINPQDRSANNTIAETFLAQIPLLKNISTNYPWIRVTVNDYFEDILNLKTDEWIYESSAHWIHFSGATRHSLEKFSHIKKLAESGKSIGVIYGIDKPFLCRAISGNIYTVFYDSVVNIVTPHFKLKYPNVESVLFYYTPELPELLIKQAHTVCQWLHKKENIIVKDRYMLDLSKSIEFNSNPARGSNWQRSIIPCIYPGLHDFVSNYWQASKQNQGFVGGMEIDNWMFKLHQTQQVVQLVQSDIKLFTRSISNKYMQQNRALGFNRFEKHFLIGHEKLFKEYV